MINIGGIKSTAGVQKIMVPIWCSNDQSDIIWYQATKNINGNYEVSSDIARHSYHLGTYHAHVYLTDKNAQTANVSMSEFVFKATVGQITLQQDVNETSYPLIIQNVAVPAGARNVLVAVWSEAGGQDDLNWYTTVQDGDNYKVDLDIRKHKTLGRYYINVYAQTKSGQLVPLGENNDLTVSSKAKADLEFSQPDGADGSFKVTVNVSDSVSGVNSVMVPVWCNDDQSDLMWYEAKKANEGIYTVIVKASNHKYHLGTYKADVYVTMGNGIFVGAGGKIIILVQFYVRWVMGS